MIEMRLVFDETEARILEFSVQTRGAQETALEWAATRSAVEAVKIWWEMYSVRSGAIGVFGHVYERPVPDSVAQADAAKARDQAKKRRDHPEEGKP